MEPGLEQAFGVVEVGQHGHLLDELSDNLDQIFYNYRVDRHRDRLSKIIIITHLKMFGTLAVPILLLTLVLLPTRSVVIKMKKQNIFIAQNSNYTFRLDISQSKSQINPINISIDHMIYNSMGTTNQYFDYFKYLSKEDMRCYNQSIGNASYLFPCPFLLSMPSVFIGHR